MIISNHTRAVIAVFTAVATTLAFTGCDEASNELADAEESVPSENETNTKLLDDNGNPYTLIKNQDGTETAKYDDGKEVTFRRGDDGGLDVVSGSAGLLAGLAAGYFLFHGMNYSGGSYSGSRYVPSSQPTVMSSYDRDRELKRYQEEKQKRGGAYVPVNNNSSTTATNNASSSTTTSKSSNDSNTKTNSSTTKSSASTSNSSNSASTKSSVSSSPKGGFGSAGARSAAS